MGQKIKVVVTGACGKVGREIIRGILKTDDLQLVGAVDLKDHGLDVGVMVGLEPYGVPITGDLERVLSTSHPHVMVDFTQPEAGFANASLAIKHNVSPVIGTTGLTQEQMDEIHELCERKQLGAVIASNFALGAVLMMRFAREAAKYFRHVEIIELHHDQKLDAPSGTALKTAQIILEERGEFRQGHPQEFEKLAGSRGGDLQGIRIHSVRLPGLIAHQEVLFGGLGQTLSIRHDSLSRESYIPGVLLAIRKVRELNKAVFGLESLI